MARARVRVIEAEGLLVPWIKVHGVDGGLTGSSFEASQAEFEFVTAEQGLYSAVVRDGSNGMDADENYELTLTGLRERGGRVHLTWPSALRAADSTWIRARCLGRGVGCPRR